MALRIQQHAKYRENDYWTWSVWIEGSEAELDSIAYVEYTLHPTFPQPVRQIKDRRTKFRLKTAGWGVFTIYATVVHKDGVATQLKHHLELRYPDGAVNVA